MQKILMVCLGNICRSPLAEGILKSKLTSNNYLIDSAGTAPYHTGKSPDPRSIQVANTYGINISKQKARTFTIDDFDAFDCIYAMDTDNYKNIIAKSRNQNDQEKVHLILDEVDPNKNLEVPDPYYGGDQGFEKVFHLLEAACEIIAQKIKHTNE